MTRPATPLLDRMADKFTIGDNCWEWTAHLGSGGYGKIWSGPGGRQLLAHRVMYELLVGPIPEGLYIDHLCRNRGCVRPAHMEPVTHAENVRRGMAGHHVHPLKTHCVSGHPYSPENTYTRSDGTRRCRTCTLRINKQSDAKRKAA